MDMVVKNRSLSCVGNQTWWSLLPSYFITTIQGSLIPILMNIITKVVSSVILQTL
jgi:hypothetical protein